MNQASIPRTDLLRGRRALVTGGASGIGRAIGEHFLHAGAQVVLADRSERVTDVARELGMVAGLRVDATDEDQVAATVAEADRLLGGVDVLVAAHGIFSQADVVDMPTTLWREMIDADLTSVFLMCRAVLPGMIARGDGRIIAIASQLGITGVAGFAHYSAAKAGVIGLTKSLAREVVRQGVLVNAIAPGPIDTPMIEDVPADWKRAKTAELPLGRFGRPDEVAPTAVLLASDPGGNLYVGQTLGPNSGDVMP
jgi:3-oxoacyl-[acyl-carrier protein] reductase